ncbi:MAG: TlpA disulfide reductase family protein [Sediminibacterium sp.]|nr:TlpA disulfide reductase family protein [Sediminibacterium sp.]
MELKKSILFIIVIFVVFSVKGQTLKLALKLQNCDEKYFLISFDYADIEVIDTLVRTGDGKYLLVTDRNFSPQITQLYSSHTVIRNVYLAPGYDMLMTGDAADRIKLDRELQFTGKGCRTNKYSRVLDSILNNGDYGVNPRAASEAEFLSGLRKIDSIKDSLVREYFFNSYEEDSASRYFGRLKQIDNRFDKLSQLIYFGKQFNKDPLYRKRLLHDSAGFISNEIQNDSLLVSASFRDFVTTDYLLYLNDIKLAALPHNKGKQNYALLKEAIDTYRGRIKQYAIRTLLQGYISSLSSEAELLNKESALKEFTNLLESDADKARTINLVNARKDELVNFSIGKKIPLFQGIDSKGKKHTIREFETKVVLIDLWATWCAPCIKEIPFLEILSQRYKDSALVILSIAVRDYISPWKSAHKNESKIWFNWFDNDNLTADCFASLWAIPRFLVIDKKGFIVSADAAPPSDMVALEKILKVALSK